MEKMTINEFKKKSNIEILQELLKTNNGYITSSLVTELGIHRMYIKIMADKNMIKKVESGVYIDSNIKEDKYYTLNLAFPNIIFSHLTSLYLQGYLQENKLNNYDITIMKNVYNEKLKKYNTFGVNKDEFSVGLIDYKTDNGNIIKIYDVERSICDVIKDRKRLDLDLIKYAVRKYLKSDKCDLNKVYNYAEKLDIKGLVKDFIDIVS